MYQALCVGGSQFSRHSIVGESTEDDIVWGSLEQVLLCFALLKEHIDSVSY